MIKMLNRVVICCKTSPLWLIKGIFVPLARQYYNCMEWHIRSLDHLDKKILRLIAEMPHHSLSYVRVTSTAAIHQHVKTYKPWSRKARSLSLTRERIGYEDLLSSA